ncbi:hypothetical protein ACFXJ6_41670 [Streptomyces sp. NPDC059218]|uniref:hypothetical protein n=1 Tax=unclassified Streptomyces TaxID=2593676 RepID=UPI0036C10B88
MAWLVEAAATGVRRIRAKMADAVALVRLYGAAAVDRALGTAATVGRFAEDDLLSILDHHGEHDRVEPVRRGEIHGLQPATFAWSGFGSARVHRFVDQAAGGGKRLQELAPTRGLGSRSTGTGQVWLTSVPPGQRAR